MVTLDDDNLLLDNFQPTNVNMYIEHVVISTTMDTFEGFPNDDEPLSSHACNCSTYLTSLPTTFEDYLNGTSIIPVDEKYITLVADCFDVVPGFLLKKIPYDTSNKRYWPTNNIYKKELLLFTPKAKSTGG